VSKDQLYKVAYDEAVRALSEQQGAIDNLRARAGLIFSTAAITTSFLGAQALRGAGLSFYSWLALLSFLAMAATSLATLWPRKWEGAANPRQVIETYIESEEAMSLEDLHRDLSLHMSHSYLENHEGHEQLALFLRIGSGFLTLEVFFWVVAIATGR
jgi:hypothetical protein